MAREQLPIEVETSFLLLGLTPSEALADPARLRTAYHRAILTEHPDKGGSDERFVAVEEAMRACQGLVAHGLTPECLRHAREAMQHPVLVAAHNVCIVLTAHRIHEATGKAPALAVRLRVSLGDAFCAHVKKLSVSVQRHGPGVAFRGKVPEPWDLDGLDDVELPTRAWHERCVVLLVPIDADTLRDGKYTFEGMGHDPLFAGCARGDIVVEISVEPHAVYRIDDVVSHADLHASIQVSVRDYYYGRRIRLPPLDPGAPPVTLDYGPDEPARVQLVRGHGLPHWDDVQSAQTRGDLFVFFELTLPAIPTRVLDRVHVRMFFEMLFGCSGLFRFETPAAKEDHRLAEEDGGGAC